jgi:hypothetical protein
VNVFSDLDELAAAAGRELGPTDWVEVEQLATTIEIDGAPEAAAVIESVIRYVG